MILGDFQFSLKTMSPNSISRTTEYNWSDAERIGDLPNLQNLGISKDQIEVDGVFYPKLNRSGFYNSVDSIRNSDLCKIASNLINDNGEILGKFVIASIKETQSYFDKNGQPQKIEFTLTLKKSPSENSVSIVDTNLARSYLKW